MFNASRKVRAILAATAVLTTAQWLGPGPAGADTLCTVVDPMHLFSPVGALGSTGTLGSAGAAVSVCGETRGVSTVLNPAGQAPWVAIEGVASALGLYGLPEAASIPSAARTVPLAAAAPEEAWGASVLSALPALPAPILADRPAPAPVPLSMPGDMDRTGAVDPTLIAGVPDYPGLPAVPDAPAAWLPRPGEAHAPGLALTTGDIPGLSNPVAVPPAAAHPVPAPLSVPAPASIPAPDAVPDPASARAALTDTLGGAGASLKDKLG
ncbi:hypothetical protein [Sinosporangium siamense]|uniref:Uncharacterized protein n=1 Tax=Sinosporangium siamense TaxID=1367973 RepID=A0A919V8V4_9ACTN|nr:hypothetical protein [Sinosporangium siamense]GII93632.1 hypothetical protein Ssi02_38630 [Sinosporangium siamense]